MSHPFIADDLAIQVPIPAQVFYTFLRVSK